jgi:hypothetical protein
MNTPGSGRKRGPKHSIETLIAQETERLMHQYSPSGRVLSAKKQVANQTDDTYMPRHTASVSYGYHTRAEPMATFDPATQDLDNYMDDVLQSCGQAKLDKNNIKHMEHIFCKDTAPSMPKEREGHDKYTHRPGNPCGVISDRVQIRNTTAGTIDLSCDQRQSLHWAASLRSTARTPGKRSHKPDWGPIPRSSPVSVGRSELSLSRNYSSLGRVAFTGYSPAK